MIALVVSAAAVSSHWSLPALCGCCSELLPTRLLTVELQYAYTPLLGNRSTICTFNCPRHESCCCSYNSQQHVFVLLRSCQHRSKWCRISMAGQSNCETRFLLLPQSPHPPHEKTDAIMQQHNGSWHWSYCHTSSLPRGHGPL